MNQINVCFIDYVYPFSCHERRWAIVDILISVFKNVTGVEPGFLCIPSIAAYEKQVDLNSSDVQNCVVFTGVERTTNSQLANKDMITIGPVYNYSRDFVIPVTRNNAPDVLYPGWGFVYALDWSVWCSLLGVMIIAVAVQMLMKYHSVDVSPTLNRETPAEIVSRSVLSTVGYSRMYQGDSHIITRHLLSCCMAFFAVGIVSLYCSNLINFFYTQSDSKDFIPPSFSVGVHPSLKDIISLETFGIFSGNRQSLRIINMMPDAIFYDNVVPVITRTVGMSFINATTTLRSLGGYQTIYETYLSKEFVNAVASALSITVQDIIVSINREIYAWARTRTDLSYYLEIGGISKRGSSPLNITDIYGVFIIMLFGYIASILFRVFSTDKTGLRSLVIYKKSPLGPSVITRSPGFDSANPEQSPELEFVRGGLSKSPGFDSAKMEQSPEIAIEVMTEDNNVGDFFGENCVDERNI